MMKKKWIILSAAALLSSSVLAFGQLDQVEAKTSADFTDLKDLDAATKAKFDAMISAGIFDGVSDTTFGLKDEMNRAQFAKVAALIYGLKVDNSLKTSSFSDVKSDDPANGYALPFIEAIKKAGITDGMGDGKFDPSGDVTKEQLATFLIRGLGQRKEAESQTGVKDETVSEWAKGYVALALELKLLSNGADGKFGGSSNATRDLLLTGAFEAKEQFVTTQPSASPSLSPTPTPTATPTPTPVYTQTPTQEPTATPTATPTVTPSSTPVVSQITYDLIIGDTVDEIGVTTDLNPNHNLWIAVSDEAIAAPAVGTNVDAIQGLSEYTSGEPIDGANTGDYIGLYETDSEGVIVKFSNIPLNHFQDLIIHTSYGVTTPIEDDTKLRLTVKPISYLNISDAAGWEYRLLSADEHLSNPPAGAIFDGIELNSQVDFDAVENDGKYIGLAVVDSAGKMITYRTVQLRVEPVIIIPTDPPSECMINPVLCMPPMPPFNNEP